MLRVKGDLLNAVRKLEIEDNYECITEAFRKYILRNSDKLLNEERSRRTQEYTDGNLSRNPQSTENLKSQKLILNSNIYGFVHDGKIYLNPDLMNENAAVHEYTHLWDAYTQKTNTELWNKDLKIFKNIKYWNEVINDTNYQDIKDDENLVLSEILY